MYYFDNSATTAVSQEVQEIIEKYNKELYFNPSSLHKFSLDITKQIEQAKVRICSCLDATSCKVIFTSGGTEADNLAIFGCLHQKKGNVVVSLGEHSAVFNCFNVLASKGYEIRTCNLNADGSVDAKHLASLIDQQTLLVSVMQVNNETGAINDVATISKIAKGINPSVIVMSDGIQAVGKVKVSLSNLNVDLYTISGHKIHAPKGIGVLLYKNVSLNPTIFGGGQQDNLRSGTENVSGIMAITKAIELATSNLEETINKYKLFNQVLDDALQEVGDCKRFCLNNCFGIYSFAVKNLQSQILLNMLEQFDIIVGLGSACNSKKKSRVMQSIGLEKEYLSGVVRISFSAENTLNEVKFLANKLQESIILLRKMKGIKICK
ncbi:MAG: cysteine desulfurase family protein [Clostridia bacterium]